MEKYELEKRYEEDDEIDLTALLKTIIRERKLIAVITVLCFILAGGFVFYRSNKPYNYGVEISFSEETANKLKQYNTLYENVSEILTQSVENSFNTLQNNKNPEVTVFSSENKKEIRETLKEKYNFLKILDTKNKNYKLFTKIKNSEIGKISERINKLVAEDTKNLNSEFNKNISENLVLAEKKLLNLTKETEELNKSAMDIIKNNFKDISQENISSNLSIISPVLYIEYQEKINSLDKTYLKVTDLEKIKNESKELFKLSGKDDITIIKLDNLSGKSNGIGNKLILAIGLVLGIFAGMFVAVIKDPLKEILKEIKEEK